MREDSIEFHKSMPSIAGILLLIVMGLTVPEYLVRVEMALKVISC